MSFVQGHHSCLGEERQQELRSCLGEHHSCLLEERQPEHHSCLLEELQLEHHSFLLVERQLVEQHSYPGEGQAWPWELAWGRGPSLVLGPSWELVQVQEPWQVADT